MTGFPGSPRVMKGAIVGVDIANPLASVVVFQYNPDTLTRTITPQTAGGASGSESAQGDALRLKGPPSETIRLDAELDAADQLEQGDPNAVTMGLHPALAALEMLVYPKSALVIANAALALAGLIEIVPPSGPLVLFIWGAKRVVPVRLTEISVTEEAFDPQLNPIRAKVTLNMRVLTYQDLGLLSAGGMLFMAHQVAKEVMATISSVSNIPSLPSTLVPPGL
jgi:hypothetical protein